MVVMDFTKMSMVAVGFLYRGVMIFHTIEGFVIFGEDGRKLDFASDGEARSFVDAWMLASTRVMIIGEVPVQ
jgi:hypothetical protein